MAVRTIPRKFYVNGVLTNATTAKLSDPTGTYGVKRNDTNAVVVADATAMTNDSTGAYSYTFTDPGVACTAWVEFVYAGSTFRYEIDIPIAAAASPDTFTYTSLCVDLADFLGWGRNTEGAGSDWTTATQNRLSDLIHGGYLQFLYPPILPGETTAHRWSFLRPTTTLATAASDYLYDMPSNFGAIASDLAYDSNDDIARVIRQVSPGLIDRKRAEDDTAGRPAYFALRPKSIAETAGQTTECILYPTPDAIYNLVYYYDAKPERLSAVNLYPLGGQPHADTLLQSCRDVAAQRMLDQAGGPEHQLFLQRLQASVEFDRRHAPTFLGYNNETGRGPCITRHGSDFTCTLKHNLGGG